MSDDAERAPPATVVERERGPPGEGADDTEVTDTEVTVEVAAGDGERDASVGELDDATLEAELQRLQRELERRETELENVVGRYERVLEHRERAREQQQTETRNSRVGPLRALARWVRRWLDGPRRR